MIFLSILFTTLIFSAIFGIVQSKGKIDLKSIQTGFYTIIIFCSALSLTPGIHINGITSFYIICITALLILLIHIRVLNLNFKGDTPYLFIFILFIICYFINNITLLRFHSSPDNHGFAATIGTFINNYSYHDLRQEFIRYTGLSEAIHLGQKTPLLNSVWNIADVRLRYTSDMIFTVGRLGLPLWGASMIPLFNSLDGFTSFMVAMGIFAAFMFSLNIRDIIVSLTNYNNKYILLPLITILLFSPFVTIYILEGTLTQFFLLTAASYYISELIIYFKSSKYDYNCILKMLICNIFISLSYPNGVILMSTISIISFPYFLIKYRSPRKIVVIISILILNYLISYLLLGEALLHLTKSFLSGVSGVPYNLSIISIFDFLSWGTNALEFASVTGPGTGFINNNASLLKFKFLIPILNLIPLLAFTIICIITFKKIGYKLFLLWPIFALFTILPILQLINITSFHTYIYARNLSNFILIGYPIFCAGVMSLNFLISRKNRIFISAFFALIAGNSIYSFVNSTKSFEYLSKPFNIIHDIAEYDNLNFSNSIIVSETPDHAISSLAIYGPVFYLTDNWNPRFYSNHFPNYINIIFAMKDGDNYSFKKIGKIKFSGFIDGPISENQLISMPIFIKN